MKLQLAHFNSLISLVTYFNNDKRCRDFITEQRWGGNVTCPFCGCAILTYAPMETISLSVRTARNVSPVL